VRWSRSISQRGLAGDKGDDHSGALGSRGRTQVRSGRHGEHNRGHNANAEAPEGAEHGGKAPQQRKPTLVSNCVTTRTINGEIEARGGCLPQARTQERLEDGGEAMKPRVDGGGLRLRKKCSGELRVMRWSLPRERARRGLNNGRRTVAVLGERRRS
jgi:hypothetical protein